MHDKSRSLKMAKEKITETLTALKVSNDSECEICCETFDTKALLVQHYGSAHKNYLATNHKVKDQFALISKLSEKSSELKAQIKSQIKEKWELDSNLLYQCDICEKTFYKTQKLRDHMKDIHVWNHEGKPKMYHENKIIEPKERGEICGNKFKNLINHTKKHRKIEQESTSKWKCEKCDKTFLKNRNLQIHFQNTHGEKNKIPCPQCGKVFIRYNSISRHIRDVHEKRHAHKCDICHKTFNRPVHLNEHMQLFHSNNQRNQCDICEKTFVDINLHKMSVHTQKIPQHKCNICEKYFHSKCILNAHYKQVHEKRNFQCIFCRIELKSRAGLGAHYRHLHMEKIHNCVDCNKSYVSVQDLEKHYLKTHLNHNRTQNVPLVETPEPEDNELIEIEQEQSKGKKIYINKNSESSENMELQIDPLKIEPIVKSELNETDPLIILDQNVEIKPEITQ